MTGLPWISGFVTWLVSWVSGIWTGFFPWISGVWTGLFPWNSGFPTGLFPGFSGSATGFSSFSGFLKLLESLNISVSSKTQSARYGKYVC